MGKYFDFLIGISVNSNNTNGCFKKINLRVDFAYNILYTGINETEIYLGKETAMFGLRQFTKNSISNQEHYWSDSCSNFDMPNFTGVASTNCFNTA